MKPLLDPEGAELEHLIAACELSGAAVLEIGCGNGSLTWQYASLPALVIGIDPKVTDLHEARNRRQASLSNVYFTQAIGEALPFQFQVFDVVLFSSSF